VVQKGTMIDFTPPPAVQFHGAHGLMKDSGIEKIFRIARNLRIPGGTDEIQHVNIAKALGLP